MIIRRAWLVCAVILGALLATGVVARADEAEGRRHWKAGQELYAQKRFLEAAHEFELGYAQAGAADGLFGDATRAAVQVAQAAGGLPASGEVDCATALALFGADAPRAP